MTEEQRKKRNEYMKKWRANNLEKSKEISKKSYLKNRDKRLEHIRKYVNDNRDEVNKRNEKYRHTNKDKMRDLFLKWCKEHPIEARANNLISGYNAKDKKYGRGKGDLTAKWIVENIFTKPCAHCGKTGWEIIGCNRIDNSKPHTKDNVEPCCFECNNKLPRKKIFA